MLTGKGEWSDDDNDSRDWRFIACEMTPPWNSWLVEGAYVRFVQGRALASKIAALLGKIYEYSDRRMYGTGVFGYIAILTGCIPAMAHCLQI